MTNCFRQLPLPEFPTSWWEIWRLVKLAPALISAWVEITRDHAIQGMSRFFPFIFQPFSTLSLKTEISQFHVSVSWSTFYNTTMIVTRYFNFLGGLPLSLVELCRISANLQLAVSVGVTQISRSWALPKYSFVCGRLECASSSVNRRRRVQKGERFGQNQFSVNLN